MRQCAVGAVTLWIKSRRAFLGVLVALLLGVSASAMTGRHVWLPQLLRSLALPVPIALLLTAAWSVFVGYQLVRTVLPADFVATRPVARLNIGLVSIDAIAFSAPLLLVGFLDGAQLQDDALMSVRNVIAFGGLVLIALAYLSPSVIALPAVTWAVISALFGADSHGAPQVWAVPIRPPTASSFMLAIALMLVGAFVQRFRTLH